MPLQHILIFIFLIVAIILYLLFKLKFNKPYLKKSRPNNKKIPQKYNNNFKIIHIQNVHINDISKAITQFCNLYNQNDYAIFIRMFCIDDHEYILTFPYDISFDIFCMFFNYITYPHEIFYKPTIYGWNTINIDDVWSTDDMIYKNIFMYIPNDDTEYDMVYLTTFDNLGFKISFRSSPACTKLENPILAYKYPEYNINDTHNFNYIDFK